MGQKALTMPEARGSIRTVGSFGPGSPLEAEWAVLFLILVLTTLAVGVLLYAGTMFLQRFLYTEPAGELYWRVPAAAGAVGLFLGLWCLLDYNDQEDRKARNEPKEPGRFGTLFDFQKDEYHAFDEFSARRKGDKEPILFKKVPAARPADIYFQNPDTSWKWGPQVEGRIVEAISIKLKDGTTLEFRPVLNEKGNLKREQGDPKVHYQEVDGSQVITQDQIQQGRLVISHPGWVFVNFLLNLLHLGVWFAGLWLLLRFQWPHALGLGVALWLVMTLTVLPMLLSKTREAAWESEPAKEEALLPAPRPPTRSGGSGLIGEGEAPAEPLARGSAGASPSRGHRTPLPGPGLRGSDQSRSRTAA
jgi:hypothetical protein